MTGHRLHDAKVMRRFFEHIVVSQTGCWIWHEAGHPRRYGRFVGTRAYRFAYEAFCGPIPSGMEIDHLCRTPECANPEHLEPVTHGENTRRAFANGRYRKAACKRGHPFTPENTYVYPRGSRECLTCRVARVNGRAA